MGVSLSRNLSILECNIPHLKDKFLPALKTIIICVEVVVLKKLISSSLYANFKMPHTYAYTVKFDTEPSQSPRLAYFIAQIDVFTGNGVFHLQNIRTNL
jgi:hypothetical protein